MSVTARAAKAKTSLLESRLLPEKQAGGAAWKSEKNINAWGCPPKRHYYKLMLVAVAFVVASGTHFTTTAIAFLGMAPCLINDWIF